MRSRNIKPGVFLNEILGQADPILTLLFEGLWCLADKEGRLEDRPLRIKAEVFPYRDFDVNGGLTQLERWGFIQRYKVDGLRLIQVVNFAKHQSPHHTERKSVLPENINGYSITVDPPLEHGGNPPDSLIPDSLIPDSPKAASPSRARSSRKKDEIPPLPGELLPFLETLTSDWPRKSHDGRRVTILRPVDSWEKICKNRGTDDPRVCINAGLAYLDLHPTEYVIGMDNFFGKDRKYTKFVVED